MKQHMGCCMTLERQTKQESQRRTRPSKVELNTERREETHTPAAPIALSEIGSSSRNTAAGLPSLVGVELELVKALTMK